MATRNARKTKLTARAARAAARTLTRRRRIGDLPIHLQIEPTSHCNYDCLMCAHKTAIAKPVHMEFDLFHRLIHRVRPYYVTFSGYGESLMHPRFFEMVRLLKVTVAGVNTTTNGFLLDHHVEDIVESGIDLINVSLDAATDASYRAIRRNEHFNKVLQNIRALLTEIKSRNSSHPVVRTTFVVQHDNQEEIVPFIRLSHELGVNGILFQPYLNPEQIDARPAGVDAATLKKAFQYALSEAQRLSMPTNLPQIVKKLGDYLEVQYAMKARPDLMKQCVKPWFSVYITADGQARPCCSFAPIPLDMGNVFREDFLGILNSEIMKNFRTTLRRGTPPHWLCARCVPDSLGDILKQTSW